MTVGSGQSDHDGRCGGPRKHGAGPCTQRAGWGTGHLGVGRCKLHGGATPSHEAAGAEQLLAQQIARLDVPAVADPLTELSKLAGQVVAWKDQLAAKVNELTELRYEGFAAEQLRAEVALWERALDRCNTVLATMAKLRIDERLAAISERQAEAVLRAIDAALDAAGVPVGERAEPKKAAARHLRAV